MSDRDSEREQSIRASDLESEMGGVEARPEVGEDAGAGGAAGGEAIDVAERNGAAGGAEEEGPPMAPMTGDQPGEA